MKREKYSCDKSQRGFPSLSDQLQEEVFATTLDVLNFRLESRMAAYVITDMGAGRESFWATEDDLAAHTSKLLKCGRLQKFLRMFNEEKGSGWSAEVESFIRDTERDFLDS